LLARIDAQHADKMTRPTQVDIVGSRCAPSTPSVRSDRPRRSGRIDRDHRVAPAWRWRFL